MNQLDVLYQKWLAVRALPGVVAERIRGFVARLAAAFRWLVRGE